MKTTKRWFVACPYHYPVDKEGYIGCESDNPNFPYYVVLGCMVDDWLTAYGYVEKEEAQRQANLDTDRFIFDVDFPEEVFK